MRECCNVYAAITTLAVTASDCLRYGIRLYISMPLGSDSDSSLSYLVVCSGFARVFRSTDMVFDALNDMLSPFKGRAYKCQLVGHFFEEV